MKFLSSLRRAGRAFLTSGLAISMVASLHAADAPLRDLTGAKDPPYVGRFAGSAIVGYSESSYDAVQFPLSNEVDDRHWVKAQTVEGKVTRVVYLAPTGTSRLEVQRNYKEALDKAGFTRKFACDADACGRSSRINEPLILYAEHMRQTVGYGRQSDPGFLVLNSDRDPHYIWGTLKAEGRDVAVGIFIGMLTGTDDDPLNNRVGVFVETVEPKAMQTGQVTIDATSMQKGLAAEGKIALYGVYFDTGRADIKPESKPQLDEMAKLLAADRAIKVYIVGHTDNQGSVDANVALSQRRADAIAQALERDYKVDPKRIATKGLASYAPVASNDNDAGRAKNRRVELVKQ